MYCMSICEKFFVPQGTNLTPIHHVCLNYMVSACLWWFPWRGRERKGVGNEVI